MRITFDLAYDQAVAPDGVVAGGAAIGRLWLGPLGLLGVVETQLGLAPAVVHQELRIQGVMERLQQLPADAAAFFVTSLAEDAWSSAKQILAWRDELMMSGWRGQCPEDASPRLQAMAAIERDLPAAVRSGVGDRIQQVLAQLNGTLPLSIATLQLHESVETLPPLLSTLMRKLAQHGVTLLEPPTYIADEASSALQQVQHAVAMAQPLTDRLPDDATMTLLQSDDEWDAARLVASWLAADQAGNPNVLLIRGGGSEVLDAALQRAGLPMEGLANPSPWRAALQVLPLALANLWEPLDVHALMAFFSHPISPLPRFVARAMSHAISREPGVGGEQWIEAKKALVEQRSQQLLSGDPSIKDASEQAQQWLEEQLQPLTAHRVDPASGVEPAVVEQICHWVKQGLQSRSQQPGVQQAMAQADRLQQLVGGCDAAISRAQLERMLDSVIAAGSSDSASNSEAAPWMRVADAGAIAGGVETVIWWNFIDEGSSPVTFWSSEDRAALAGIGVALEPAEQIHQRHARWRHNALFHAKERLLLVQPRRLQGEDTVLHPLWHEIDHFSGDASGLICDGTAQLQQPVVTLAGRSWQQEPLPRTAPIEPDSYLSIAADSIAKPKKLSFSQMNTMIGCPAKWALHYHANLRGMDALSLPSGNTMIGSLCHKVVEQLFGEGKASATATATVRKQAQAWFDRLVPNMAAELLQPGRELERARYRHQVGTAVEALMQAIDEAGLFVQQCEPYVDGKDVDGVPFGGYIDLLLEDDDGHVYVIDMKWSGSRKYKAKEIEEGKALQLASYAWLLRRKETGLRWAHSGYFMLAQGELLTPDSAFAGTQPIASAASLAQTWSLGSKTWRGLLEQLQQGTVEVSGLIDEKDLKKAREADGWMAQRAPCHFCDFGKLCGTDRESV